MDSFIVSLIVNTAEFLIVFGSVQFELLEVLEYKPVKVHNYMMSSAFYHRAMLQRNPINAATLKEIESSLAMFVIGHDTTQVNALWFN